MKRLTIALLLLATSAHADVTMYAGKGTGKPVATFQTFEACVLAGNALRKKFTCKETIQPVPPCPAKPADVTKTNVCPAPSIGEWTSTSTFTAAPSPTCWAAGAFTPATAPAGACVVPPPVPPQQPPIDMTGVGPYIDMNKLMTPATGYATERVDATTELPVPGTQGEFRTSCTPAKMGLFDFIVSPGLEGIGHLHTFFGNTGVNKGSTAESLRTTGNSTCRGGIANRSAYWVPTMIDTKDGTPLIPANIGTYYKNGAIDGSLIQPMPEGLRMIAGDPKNAGPGFEWRARFKCIGGPNKQNALYGAAIGDCDAGAQLWSEVFFPQCWMGNGQLDSPDHKSHMAYPITVRQPDGTSKRQCPATHPIPLAQVTFNVVYNVPEAHAALRWRLSCDAYDVTKPGGYCSHGDWFNGWKPEISNAWDKNCIQAKADCHSHLLGAGRKIF